MVYLADEAEALEEEADMPLELLLKRYGYGGGGEGEGKEGEEEAGQETEAGGVEEAKKVSICAWKYEKIIFTLILALGRDGCLRRQR